MTREARVFRGALLASLALHAVLLVLFVTLPGGGPEEPVRVYTVRIMEAPARPQAQGLELSTAPISALKLEGPSLSPDTPPVSEPATPEVPELERFPGATPPSTTQSAALRPPEAGTPPAPTAPTDNGPKPPAVAATAPAAPQPTLPALPGLPPRPPASAPATPQAPTPATGAPEAPPLPPADDEPARPSAMEQLRSKVQTLNLEVEAAPPDKPGTPGPSRERNVLSFRVYSNRVREAVKEQYAFPGGFDANLRTRVRLVLNRDGSVRSTEIMQSSGNERFDRLVCLAAFKKARIPAIPQGLEPDADKLTLHFTCSP